MSSGMEIVPPSSRNAKEKKGWDFTQDGKWFADYDRDGLVGQVTEYRVANSIPLGDVNQEVLEFNASKTSAIVPTRKIVSLREKVIKWLETKLRTKPKYVDEQEANRRAAICVNCPQNIQNWTVGEKCGRCIENANRAAAIILQGKPQHRPIGACHALSQQNKVAVWLDLPPIEDASLPSFCWRRSDNFDAPKEINET